MVARRERRWDHRDFERWCLRIETVADTKTAPENGGGDEENEMGFGNSENKRRDFRELIEKAMDVSREFHRTDCMYEFPKTEIWR